SSAIKLLVRCSSDLSAGLLDCLNVVASTRRNREREYTAFFCRKLGPGASTDRLDRFPHDAEPESGAGGLSHRLVMSTVEFLEQPLATIRGNADAIVADANDHFPVALVVGAFHSGGDGHPTLRLRVVGILDSVRQVIH